MKKIVLPILAGLVLASSAIAAPEKLRVVGSWGHLTMFSEFEKPYWKKEFKKSFPNTSTRVTSLGQVKLKGSAVYRQLAKGSFDVVSTVGGYVVSDSQTLAGLDLPAIAPDIQTAKKIVNAYKPTLAKALAKDFNAILLGVTPYPAQILFCNEKIDSLSDLKGKKVRAGSWTTAEYLDGLGATGVTPPFSEIASALQRGVLDCAIGGGLSGYSSGWGNISKYLYPIPVGGWAYVLTAMNMETWNKFSKEEQEKLISSYNTNVIEPVWAKSDFESIEGVKCLTGQDCSYGKSYNMNLVQFKEKDIAISKKILEERVLPKWSQKVSSEVVNEWNNSVGKVVNLKAEKE
ncbi:TRAP transporter substrate-binding protein [Poseidonibacter lekithochrous]|uniref:TRAP transporter substrate-binding protein n=1 Tax=Poseidonibacter lekithochrous TaxID=1904463 RepID=UPI0008FC3072|nr:TRAP transporter substrate-binding protein [Poseidonibacter lekithochrous]QKJ23639.1 TRAP transporter, substrate binding protein, DctP family [Poseidonibacter lekithochrous]